MKTKFFFNKSKRKEQIDKLEKLFLNLSEKEKDYYIINLSKIKELQSKENCKFNTKKLYKLSFVVSIIFLINTSLIVVANIDIFDSIIKITKEFINQEVKSKVELKEDLVIYKNIEDLEKDFNIDIPIMKEMPQEYMLSDINIYKTYNNWSKLFVYYLNGNEQIIYRINNLYSSQKITIEKDEQLIEKYKLNEFFVYITENNNWKTATWSNKNMKFEIHGKFSVEVLKDMINSIYN